MSQESTVRSYLAQTAHHGYPIDWDKMDLPEGLLEAVTRAADDALRLNNEDVLAVGFQTRNLVERIPTYWAGKGSTWGDVEACRILLQSQRRAQAGASPAAASAVAGAAVPSSSSVPQPVPSAPRWSGPAADPGGWLTTRKRGPPAPSSSGPPSKVYQPSYMNVRPPPSSMAINGGGGGGAAAAAAAAGAGGPTGLPAMHASRITPAPPARGGPASAPPRAYVPSYATKNGPISAAPIPPPRVSPPSASNPGPAFISPPSGIIPPYSPNLSARNQVAAMPASTVRPYQPNRPTSPASVSASPYPPGHHPHHQQQEQAQPTAGPPLQMQPPAPYQPNRPKSPAARPIYQPLSQQQPKPLQQHHHCPNAPSQARPQQPYHHQQPRAPIIKYHTHQPAAWDHHIGQGSTCQQGPANPQRAPSPAGNSPATMPCPPRPVVAPAMPSQGALLNFLRAAPQGLTVPEIEKGLGLSSFNQLLRQSLEALQSDFLVFSDGGRYKVL